MHSADFFFLFFFFSEHVFAANSYKTLGVFSTALTKLSELLLFKWLCLSISVVRKNGLKNEFGNSGLSTLLNCPHLQYSGHATFNFISYFWFEQPKFLSTNLLVEELALIIFPFDQVTIC